MPRLRFPFLLAALGALAVVPPALADYQESYSFTTNTVIPDGDLSGLALSQNVSTIITSLTSVEVTLNISGGFTGDYYAYLVHNTPGGNGFSILLNRVGRTAGNPFGYGDSGMNVTFSGSALFDIHSYQSVTNPGGGPLGASTWQPDGRNVSPGTVLDTDPRTALLSSFQGLDANGTWTLFIADTASLGQGSLVSWGLTFHSVPEPGTWAAGTLALGCLAGWMRRRR